MAPHSSTLAWKIPWMEEPGRLQSMRSLRVGHGWATSLSLFTFMHWRRKRQPTPVFLPGESQGRGSLVGCRLWGHTESNTTEAAAIPWKLVPVSRPRMSLRSLNIRAQSDLILPVLFNYFLPSPHLWNHKGIGRANRNIWYSCFDEKFCQPNSVLGLKINNPSLRHWLVLSQLFLSIRWL